MNRHATIEIEPEERLVDVRAPTVAVPARSTSESIDRGMGLHAVRAMYVSSNAHGGAARPEVGGRHSVGSQAAASWKLEYLDTDRCVSDEPKLRRPSSDSIRSKGGEPSMSLSDWFEYARLNWKKEEGQTMAEYGVILAVITVGIVVALTALSTGIQGALTSVVGRL